MDDLLFIGHSYHRKTGSSDFVIDLLKERFNLTVCHVAPDFADLTSTLHALPRKSFQVVVCWQVMPHPDALRRIITFERGVLFPMFDAAPSTSKVERWLPFSGFLIICFCAHLHQRLTRLGFASRRFTYFPPVPDDIPPGHPSKAFFWYRNQTLPPQYILALCKTIGVTHLHIHNSPDPGVPPLAALPPSEIAVSTSTWFDHRSDLERVMNDCAIYVAPRAREGIGMSFLEALAHSRCVLALDAPTMNEYLAHGENGILFTSRSGTLPLPAPLDIPAIQREAGARARQARKTWLAHGPALLDAVQADKPRPRRRKIALRLAIRFLRSPLTVSRRLLPPAS